MQVFQIEMSYAFSRDMAFSPDGRFLAVHVNNRLTLLDTTGGPARPVPEAGYFSGVFAFIRDDTILRHCSYSGIQLLHLESGKKRRIGFQSATAHSIAVSPNANRLFVSVYNYGRNKKHNIRVVQLANMKRRTSFAPADEYMYRLILSADGRWLAGLSSVSGTLRAWNVGEAELPSRASLKAERREFRNDIALSFNGSHLVEVDNHGLSIWNTSSGEHLRSGKHRRGVTAVACSPTRPIFVAGDSGGQVFLWDYTGRVLTRYDWGLSKVHDLCFALDSLRCAALDTKGKVVVWDVDL